MSFKTISLSVAHLKTQDQKGSYSWRSLRCNAKTKGWTDFQDNPVPSKVSYFCGCYIQEIKHFGGEDMLYIVWVE